MISNKNTPDLSFEERFNKIAQSKNELENETDSEFYKRNLGQNAARVGELYLGLPGNLKKAAGMGVDYVKSLFPEGTFQDLNELEEEAFGENEKGGYADLIMNPPTSSDLRNTATKNISNKLTGKDDYLEPKSEGEKNVGELTQDIASFFMPGTSQLRLITRLGAPVLGYLTKHGAKYLGASDETAEKAKLGLMLATTLSNQSNPGQFSGQRIQQAKSMIPDTATVNAMPLANRLMPLYNRMQKGLGVPSKSKAIQGMQDLAGQVENGRINLRSLMDARDHINEWIAEAGGWDIPQAVRNPTMRNLNELKSQIITTIEENMANRFPQAEELYRTGYEASAVTHQSNAISSFIEKNFGKKASSVGAKILFPSIAGGAAFLPKTAAVGAATYPLYKSGQVLYRVANSPTLARYYRDVIVNSTLGNAAAMSKSLEKFDKELAKDEKKRMKGKPMTLEEFKAQIRNKG